jgi:PAS domain S-box-containing protein
MPSDTVSILPKGKPAKKAGRAVTGSPEASDRYRLLFEGELTAVYRSTVDGRILDCNEALVRALGYDSREELLATPASRLYPDPSHRDEFIARLRREKSFISETRMKRKDGSAVWVLNSSTLVEGRDGEPDGLEGTFIDITERKRREEELRAAELKYRALVEQLPAITYIAHFGAEGAWEYVSPQIQTLLGFSPEELIANPRLWYERLHPEDRERALEDETQAWKSGEPLDSEYRMLARDGRVVWFRDRGSIVRDENGQALHLHGVMLNVTARRQAEERFHSIFENAIEGIFQTTPKGRYLSVNPALARMYGYASPAELMAEVQDIGKEMYVDPARRHQFKELMESTGLVEGFEYQVRRKDGAKIWFSENARAVKDATGKLRYYEGTVEDITERKRAEAERQVTFEIIHGATVTDNLDDLLRLIHQSLQKVLYAENCFVALHDPAAGTFYFPFFVDQCDSAPPPQKVGRSCTAYVFHTGRAMLIPQSVFDQLAEQGEVELVGTASPSWLGVPLRTPSATIGVLVVQHYEDERAYTERDLEFLASVGGQIAMAIERKRVETAQRESEARLRVLIEQLPAVLWTVDNDLRFTSSLGAGLARMGLKPNEVVGMSLPDYFQTTDQGFMPIAAHRRAIAGEPVTFHIEWAGGSYACHAEPLRAEDGRVQGAICMALDITDRKHLEAQLRQAQKMEAVGRLAGGIAHDFNNLLMVIQGYTELLLERLGVNDPLRRNADQIREASERAASLTRQLLAFSRKQVLAPKVLNMRIVVADMEKMLRRLIGEDVELATLTPPGLWNVKADRSQVEQVILNLAVNARDAMPRGGKLTIETANVELDNSYSHHQAVVAPGRYVMLAVADTGCGMDAETQAHVFEPFFTTKEKGKGTGLGLATVYGVVKQSGGYVWVYSEPGHGTTFKVYLPRVEESVGVEEKAAEAEAPQRGSETILLVEDEKGVRELAREYLVQNGYTVLDAENGARALEIARGHDGPIHLMLTDVVMQGLSGRELAEKAAKIRPDMKVLFMSGYTDQAVIHHGLLSADTVLLQKPFTLNALATKLRATLDLGSSQ